MNQLRNKLSDLLALPVQNVDAWMATISVALVVVETGGDTLACPQEYPRLLTRHPAPSHRKPQILNNIQVQLADGADSHH